MILCIWAYNWKKINELLHVFHVLHVETLVSIK